MSFRHQDDCLYAYAHRGKDAFGYRAELVNLIEIAALIRDLKK